MSDVEYSAKAQYARLVSGPVMACIAPADGDDRFRDAVEHKIPMGEMPVKDWAVNLFPRHVKDAAEEY